MQASQSGPTLKVICKSLRVEWTTGCFKNCPCEGDGWLKGQGEGQPNQYSARGRHVSQGAFTFVKLISFLKRLYVKVMFQWAGMKISQAYIKYFRFFALKLGCLSTGRNILVGGMSVSGQ